MWSTWSWPVRPHLTQRQPSRSSAFRRSARQRRFGSRSCFKPMPPPQSPGIGTGGRPPVHAARHQHQGRGDIIPAGVVLRIALHQPKGTLVIVLHPSLSQGSLEQQPRLGPTLMGPSIAIRRSARISAAASDHRETRVFSGIEPFTASCRSSYRNLSQIIPSGLSVGSCPAAPRHAGRGDPRPLPTRPFRRAASTCHAAPGSGSPVRPGKASPAHCLNAPVPPAGDRRRPSPAGAQVHADDGPPLGDRDLARTHQPPVQHRLLSP